MSDQKEPSSVEQFGRQVGWAAAATAKTARLLPSLKPLVAQFHAECRAYLKENHPDASEMEQDAMRHAYVSAKMSSVCGKDYTLYLGYLNEAKRDVKHSNNQGDRGMDLFNNQAGIAFFQDNPTLSKQALLAALWQKTQDGTLVISQEDMRTQERCYSDDGHLCGPAFKHINSVSMAAHQMVAKCNPFGSKSSSAAIG